MTLSCKKRQRKRVVLTVKKSCLGCRMKYGRNYADVRAASARLSQAHTRQQNGRCRVIKAQMAQVGAGDARAEWAWGKQEY